VAPIINSGITRLVGVGSPFKQYTITASGAPFGFVASGLPPGLTLNGENINGTPTQAGTYAVSLVAFNYYRPGSTLEEEKQPGTKILNIYVSGARPLATTSLFGVNDLRVGVPASLSAGDGLRVSGFGLPTGLSFNKATGLITGTPTAAGTFAATLFIQNGKGWISKDISLTVR
jgi:hypothetical protein